MEMANEKIKLDTLRSIRRDFIEVIPNISELLSDFWNRLKKYEDICWSELTTVHISLCSNIFLWGYKIALNSATLGFYILDTSFESAFLPVSSFCNGLYIKCRNTFMFYSLK